MIGRCTVTAQCTDAIMFRVGTVEDELPTEIEGGHQVKVLPASRVVSLQRAQASGAASSSRDPQ
jgi:hypothetical protein